MGPGGPQEVSIELTGAQAGVKAAGRAGGTQTCLCRPRLPRLDCGLPDRS